MLNSALIIIQEEHRSLAAVSHGLRYVVRQIQTNGAKPDFKLLWAMIYYLEEFPAKLHHPKEDAYLFARLRVRTQAGNAMLSELERQHVDGAEHVRDLERALGHYEAGRPNGQDDFFAAVERFGSEIVKHMAIEENMIFPLARAYLTDEDWVEVAAAFSENGDPRFDTESDLECRDLFTRIVNLAPPPIGVGPVRK